MKWTSTWFLVGSFLFNCQQEEQKLLKVDLNEEWKFRQEDARKWYSAEVPGVVHTDLLSHEHIPHPWVGTNEKKVQWIEEENWEYKLEFELDDQVLRKKRLELVFEGLDTYAEVVLNDSPILNADNMFRRWRVDVTSNLRKGPNQLSIHFLSPISVNIPKVEALDYSLPAGSEDVEYKVSPFTRKAPYHFGWDWGPRLVTSGIWRPVYLEAWDNARFEDVQIIQKSLSDSIASLEAVLTIVSQGNQDVKVSVYDKDQSVTLKEGVNHITIPFAINDPERWWPNGWGAPKLYEIPVSLYSRDILIDSATINVGLRTVELIQEKDSIGESFYFKVNGEPLFARGANYIPQSHFLPSVSKEDYEQLIRYVKEANMNMLRVWGGGVYEDDQFYELCDKNGILVWQDFMFAGSMYPGDSAFLKNVEEEVRDNVKRLRNHPSIVHWNGNNEIDVAWNNWGWQKQYGYSEADSTQLWEDYLYLFDELIPGLLERMDDRPYTATSPLSNWGTPENFNYGSMHYWGVWHGHDDFEAYKDNVGRFMSEYGFQSFPNMETIGFFADSHEWHIESEVVKHHQKSYVGNGLILQQIEKYFGSPLDFPDFVEKSQQTQALAMQMAIDAHRLKKGHCWGSLYWQLNDCWPGPSWSSIDVFGKKKELHEELRVLFSPVTVIPSIESDILILTLVNDQLEKFDGELQLTIIRSSDKNEDLVLQVNCKANRVNQVVEIPKEDIKEIQLKLYRQNDLVTERNWVVR